MITVMGSINWSKSVHHNLHLYWDTAFLGRGASSKMFPFHTQGARFNPEISLSCCVPCVLLT